MKNNTKQPKVYICKFCKEASDSVGIARKEVRYYRVDLDTKQWEDYFGSEDVGSEEFFCVNCNKKIDDFELE
ncbi:MAG: hypothetical protein PHX30_00485 [Candidatus Pacebacteria bacterium]|nr:hypothetical protein [Candidatus Paceibacterota bacterium]